MSLLFPFILVERNEDIGLYCSRGVDPRWDGVRRRWTGCSVWDPQDSPVSFRSMWRFTLFHVAGCWVDPSTVSACPRPRTDESPSINFFRASNVFRSCSKSFRDTRCGFSCPSYILTQSHGRSGFNDEVRTDAGRSRTVIVWHDYRDKRRGRWLLHYGVLCMEGPLGSWVRRVQGRQDVGVEMSPVWKEISPGTRLQWRYGWGSRKW